MADLTVSANVDSLLASANTAAMLAVLGVTALGTTTPAAGVATFLATPSSANLKTAVTDETGSGALVFANTPTLVTPDIGAATGTSLVASSSVSAPTFIGTGTTPTALCLPAGTGNIPALPANSGGFSAPASGGTAYVLKMPTNTAAGLLSVNTAATVDNVNTGQIVLSNTLPAATTVDGTNPVGYRNMPLNAKTGSYTLLATDQGKVVPNTTGGWTVNNAVHAAGDVISLYNDSGSSQNITAGTITTMRLAGSATTGTRALALRGLATLYFHSSSEVVVSGVGVT